MIACDGASGGRVDTILSLSGDVTNGEDLYTSNCVSCHAADGSGGIGSNIQGVDVDVTVDAVLNGRGNEMAAYGDLLTDQEIADLTAYVETL